MHFPCDCTASGQDVIEVKSTVMATFHIDASGPAYLLQVEVDLCERFHFLLQGHGVGGVLSSSVVLFFIAIAGVGVCGAL